MPAELVDWVSQMPVEQYFVRDGDPYEFDTLNSIFTRYDMARPNDFSLPVGAYKLSNGHKEPFRLRVQKALTVALRQIAPSNGFYCSLVLPSSIFRGRQTFGTEVDDALAMERDGILAVLPDMATPYSMDLERAIEGGLKLSILEEPFTFDKDLAPSTGKARVEPYELILQGFAPSKGKTDDAHLLLADVKKRLVALKLDEDLKGKRIFRIGTKMNSVVSLTFDGGVVRPPDSDSPSDHFWMRVSFQVAEDYSAPGA